MHVLRGGNDLGSQVKYSMLTGVNINKNRCLHALLKSYSKHKLNL